MNPDAPAPPDVAMRGMHLAGDLWTWPAAALSHDAFARLSGLHGIRLRLRGGPPG